VNWMLSRQERVEAGSSNSIYSWGTDGDGKAEVVLALKSGILPTDWDLCKFTDGDFDTNGDKDSKAGFTLWRHEDSANPKMSCMLIIDD
jgi:hypothetical protein